MACCNQCEWLDGNFREGRRAGSGGSKSGYEGLGDGAARTRGGAAPAAPSPLAHLRGTTQKANRVRKLTAKKTRETVSAAPALPATLAPKASSPPMPLTTDLAAATALFAAPAPTPAPAAPSFALKALNPDTGELAEYNELLACSDGLEWNISSCKEWGRLAQGYRNIKGTDTIQFIPHAEVPSD